MRTNRRIRSRTGQRGVALFTAIFLVVVIALVAGVVALTTVTQQSGAARSLDQEQAGYAARARLETAFGRIISDDEGCAAVSGNESLWGFTTDMPDCAEVCAREGGDYMTVFSVRVRASRGDAASGTLVRRSVRTQFVRPEDSC